MSTATPPSQATQESSAPVAGKPRPAPLRGEPYSKKASGWLLALKTCLLQAGVSPAARHAIETMAARELKLGHPLDWSTTQMATGSCDRRTIDRNVQRLLEHALIEIVEVGCHAIRKATLYRLTRLLPSFQRAVCPSPLEQSSKRTKNPAKGNIQHKHKPAVVPMPDVPPSRWDGTREEILKSVSELGKVSASGFRSAEENSPFQADLALQVAQAAVAVARTRAKRNPIGWALSALRDEAFGRSLLTPPPAKQDRHPSPWGEEAPEVVDQLRAVPTDPGGIATAKAGSWCDGPTALLVLEGCRVSWRSSPPANPGGFAVQALVSRGLGEAMLAEIKTIPAEATPLGRALQAWRLSEAENRALARLEVEFRLPEENRCRQITGNRGPRFRNLADAVRPLLPAGAYETALDRLCVDMGVTMAAYPTSFENRAAIRAGLAVGLLSGWDLQAV